MSDKKAPPASAGITVFPGVLFGTMAWFGVAYLEIFVPSFSEGNAARLAGLLFIIVWWPSAIWFVYLEVSIRRKTSSDRRQNENSAKLGREE